MPYCSSRLFHVIFAASILIASLPVSAADGRLSLTTGIDYTTGSYGESSDTTITYIPFTGKYETGRWIFGLTIPYIKVDGPGNVFRDTGAVGSTTGASRSESGMGDIVASASYNLWWNTEEQSALDLTGKLKLATADERKNLGTGEEDLHVQLDAYRAMGRWTPFATLGYKFLGDPPGLDLKDVFFASAGATYRLDDIRSVGAMWYGQQKTTAGGSPQNEVTGFYSHKFDADWRGQAYGLLGLSNGSPDYGVGLTVTRIF